MTRASFPKLGWIWEMTHGFFETRSARQGGIALEKLGQGIVTLPPKKLAGITEISNSTSMPTPRSFDPAASRG